MRHNKSFSNEEIIGSNRSSRPESSGDEVEKGRWNGSPNANQYHSCFAKKEPLSNLIQEIELSSSWRPNWRLSSLTWAWGHRASFWTSSKALRMAFKLAWIMPKWLMFQCLRANLVNFNFCLRIEASEPQQLESQASAITGKQEGSLTQKLSNL